jgi:predicted enzyme related to lactoylglutathione lyase
MPGLEVAMADVNLRGRFVWYDLMTTDPEKAKDFYTKVTGWGTTVWDGSMPYTMWTVDGAPMGGVMQLPPGAGAPPHWLGYIGTPDVDATVAQVQSLGGTVLVAANDIPTVGRYAVLGDPQGAAFAVYSPAKESPEKEGPPSIGEFSWHELLTTEYEAAFAFYATLFGWEKIQAHDMGEMGIYLIFGRKGKQLGGMFNKPSFVQAPPNWLHYIAVDSADRAAELVKANGGTLMQDPMDVPGGDRIAQCMDPQGGAFAVHSRKA